MNELFQNFTEYLKIMADNDDDEFFHITCHVEASLRAKIEKGEYVELEKLLPKDRMYQFKNEGQLRLWHKNGETYLAPPAKENKINSIRRWEQAFRVYAAIYCNANPNRSGEIWQYIFTINTAASSFPWESVAYYDYTFRQLMHTKPDRSWGKIYNQLWNIAFRGGNERQNNFQTTSNATSSSGSNNQGRTSYGDWRDNCCWHHNKSGKCTKWNCKFDHRCKSCGGWNHGSNSCYKKKQNGGGSYSQDKGNGNNKGPNDQKSKVEKV